MSRSTRITFGVHFFVALLLGLPMLLAPGRWLDIVEWQPVDPIISRLFGAALLALAWGSFRSWRATDWDQVAFIVELEVVFTMLGIIGLLRHLIFNVYPWYVWTLFLVLALFAIAWIVALIKK